MTFVKCEIFYLVRIEPLLKPQLALPAEEEDKLDHGDQAEVGFAWQAELSLLSLSCLLMQAHSLHSQSQRGSENVRYSKGMILNQNWC